MKCKFCGADIPENSKFCLECGAKVETPDAENRPQRKKPMHSACGNNQTCGGRSDIVIRNGFVYRIIRGKDQAEITVTPVSDEDKTQVLYYIKGKDADLSCINMVEDELIFSEKAEEEGITALDVYSGDKRQIITGYRPEAMWIENEIITFVQDEKLYSLHYRGGDFFEYNLDFPLADRLIGYGGRLYTCLADTGEAVELSPYETEVRPMGFEAGEDMIYAIIGCLYYSPVNDANGSVIMCRNIESLEVRNGIQDTDRLLTAFEQYVLFNKAGEPEWSFLWNIQTLRVYKLNRRVDLHPYSFSQALSDYIFLENEGNLYKVPAPVFFQGDEDIFVDKFLF